MLEGSAKSQTRFLKNLIDTLIESLSQDRVKFLPNILSDFEVVQKELLENRNSQNLELIYDLTFNLLLQLARKNLVKQFTSNYRKHFEAIFINFYQLMKNLIDFNDIETFKLVIAGLFGFMEFQVLANLDLKEDYYTLYKPHLDNENRE
jgi:hypothetical protein